MTALFFGWFLCGFVLFLVGTVYLLRALERRSPAFHRWLDERFGPETNW